MMKRVNRVELTGSLALGAFGIFYTVKAFGYRMGTLSEMGPGFFPLVVGLMITSLAGIILLAGIWKERDKAWKKPDLRAMFWTLCALVAFALLVRPFGIIPAVVVLILTCLAARSDTTWPQAAVIAAGLAILAYLLFIVGLGLNLSALRWGV
ncbi:tripartite tricarboxylate transporter TctB family protein [Hoeflea ulvae]|uniref:Tripartite tricarboxylate transporter TctB family protein n=1 Tax=Hoeflea ulvae TaxID=2983764 RepID=A0ABT3YC15_9HYPH|nr:tripartite tricarboxylate transporter TctB family protein [Hoeflea ulvae]MCY0093425.1 tripartite tricarboxylate transporter TctB family protein [Hoeflea ulvae]